ALVSGLSDPQGIAISGSNLFESNAPDSDFGTINEYTTSGAPINVPLITGLDESNAMTVVVVPEPASAATLAVAASGLMLRRRRREQAKGR
ncbi:MAG TPA: PEP-CTERM sorting domain-containing protein, partial [Tepidisphaeraceae bacterium]|nr:PEP-CTERM sorting domain-containing protein [Tepidisphaeraceae bacterium]